MATEVISAAIPLNSVGYGVNLRDSSKNPQRGTSESPAQKPAELRSSKPDSESVSSNLPLASGLNSYVAQQAASVYGEDDGQLPEKLSDKTSDSRLESADDAQAIRDERTAPEKKQGVSNSGLGETESGQPQQLSEKEVGIPSGQDEQGEPKKLFSDEERDEELAEEREKEQTAYWNDGLSKLYSRGSDLYGADLSGQALAGGQFSKADFRQASLVGVNLSGADLRNADFSNADLTGADLSGANLNGANFTGAFIANANLSGATGTKYDGSGKLTLDRATTLSRIDLTA